ncbi:MAG: bifunctional acetate--CoA ligase family protein/GNAT family N-acetyltransferase [Pirellulales bacterium]
MPIRNLEHLFSPRCVAVIGASDRPSSVGRTVFQNLLRPDFSGRVFPINPRHEQLEGRPCFKSVAELPERPDLVVIATPAATVPGLVRECGAAGAPSVIILSAGFRETGPAGAALERAIQREAAAFEGLRILGPNCLGVLSPHTGLNASFAADMPPKGRIAFISQSGALCTSVLDWALRENVGFSHFVSVGNMLDVSLGSLIDFFALDPHTDAILLYIESLDRPRHFMSAARGFTRKKPIIAYKSGRFAESAQAAASHTGAMAGMDAVYEAALRRAGIVRVFDVEHMFDCAELLASHHAPRGSRLAIVTNAGGPGVMATDELIERQGTLANLGPETIAALNDCLPPAWSHGNPVDVLGDASPERFAQAVQLVLNDPQVDAVVVVLTPQAMTDPTRTAEVVIEVAGRSRKPVIAAWMGGERVAEGIRRLNAAQIPTYASPEQAVRALMYLASYARRREMLYETPRDLPVEFPLDRAKLRAVFDTILSEGHEVLTESTSKSLLEAYEIPVAKPYVAWTVDDACKFAQRLGFPVALKIHSPSITHKTDVGGVMLNLADEAQVAAAFERMMTQAASAQLPLDGVGVTVQRMVTAPNGHEWIVGAKRDPVFGAVLLVGAGGVTAELYQDCALELPPLTERLARRMLESLKSWPLLSGYRGRPAANIDRLVEILIRVSYLAADYPEIVELDINPLLVTPDQAVALDARIVLDRSAILTPVRRYSHLAIRPYPEELTRTIRLPDGETIVLRPIRPEDEPLWHELLAGCSPESIRFRFRYLFSGTTHEMATRFCFIDYDREIAIVAIAEESATGRKQIRGVGRLVADADHRDAEYAVLVGDRWQGQGVGTLLTDYCLEICRAWGIQRVVAETAPDNHRMLELFERCGFEIDAARSQDTVFAERRIS